VAHVASEQSEPDAGRHLDVQSCYPGLACVDPSLAQLPAICGPHLVQAGKLLFDANQPCPGLPLLLSGEVKVFRQSGDGRSLELYRITRGELCLVSSASLFHGRPLTATAITTRPTELLVVPADVFHRWLDQRDFRAHVLGLFAERMSDLTALVDAIAFQKLDQRLAAALLGRGPELVITHQALAEQLGTAREIVSRLLSRFERSSWVQLSRERIRIIDSAALRAHAEAGE